jgi:hypothetical protein
MNSQPHTGSEMTAGPGRGDFGREFAHLCENRKGLKAPHRFLGRGFVTGAYSRQEIGKGGNLSHAASP